MAGRFELRLDRVQYAPLIFEIYYGNKYLCTLESLDNVEISDAYRVERLLLNFSVARCALVLFIFVRCQA